MPPLNLKKEALFQVLILFHLLEEQAMIPSFPINVAKFKDRQTELADSLSSCGDVRNLL